MILFLLFQISSSTMSPAIRERAFLHRCEYLLTPHALVLRITKPPEDFLSNEDLFAMKPYLHCLAVKQKHVTQKYLWVKFKNRQLAAMFAQVTFPVLQGYVRYATRAEASLIFPEYLDTSSSHAKSKKI